MTEPPFADEAQTMTDHASDETNTTNETDANNKQEGLEQNSVAKLSKELNLHTRMVIEDTSKLLERIFVNKKPKNHYRLPYDLSTAKRYLLSRCLMNVQHAAFSMVRLIAYLEAYQTRNTSGLEGMHPVMASSIITEQSVWRRQLAEVLATLINFTKTNTDEHFYHYLLVQDAVRSGFEAKNTESDFGVRSDSFHRRHNDICAQADVVARSIASTVWYANLSGSSPKLSSAGEIFRKALVLASPKQRQALSESYSMGFSSPSDFIHFSASSPAREPDKDLLRFGQATIFLLCVAICGAAADLLGLSEADIDLCAFRHVPRKTVEQASVGDFVVVTLDNENRFLAEVISHISHPTGTLGMKVRFLEEAPYPGLTEDKFPSNLIHPFLKLSELMSNLVQQHPVLAEISEAERLDRCRKAVVMTWQMGVKPALRYAATSAYPQAPHDPELPSEAC